MTRIKPAHHRGTHQARAKRLTNAANADPTTRCWQCQRTQAEHGRRWTAGHVHDGQIDGPLMPECEHCNYSRGAQTRTRNQNPRSETL